MLSRRGFRFELRARPGELRQARRIAGACRWVWNRALAIQKQAMDQGAKRPRYLDLASQLTAWRNSPGRTNTSGASWSAHLVTKEPW